jgi:hypothetical protein
MLKTEWQIRTDFLVIPQETPDSYGMTRKIRSDRDVSFGAKSVTQK